MLEIRVLEEKDIIAASELARTTTLDCFSAYFSKQLVAKWVAKNELEAFRKRTQEIEYFVADDDGLVGIIGLQNDYVKTFYVSLDRQNEGIGKKLYQHIEQIAKERGIVNLNVKANILSIPVYEALGFEKIRMEKRNDGEEFALMQKKII
jgi:GNAT superfamily N-acetyltransferase